MSFNKIVCLSAVLNPTASVAEESQDIVAAQRANIQPNGAFSDAALKQLEGMLNQLETRDEVPAEEEGDVEVGQPQEDMDPVELSLLEKTEKKLKQWWNQIEDVFDKTPESGAMQYGPQLLMVAVSAAVPFLMF